jgi:hypothetical protein
MQIVEILAPVFLVVVLGVALRWWSVVPEGFGTQANRLVYRVALPVLLFRKLSAPDQAAQGALELFVVMAAGTGVAIAAAYLVAVLTRLPSRSVGSFVQASFRGNLAYVGLPIVLLAFDRPESSSVATAAVVAIAPLIVVYNVAAILVLTLGSGRHGAIGAGTIVRQVLSNPLIIAIVAGLVWSWTGVRTPGFVARTLEMIGGAALPLALLALGGSLVDTRLRGRITPSLWAASIKLVIAPAAGWVIGAMVGLEPRALRVAILFLACPTAVASFVLAEQLGGDAALSGGVVMVSTILSAVTLTMVLVLV